MKNVTINGKKSERMGETPVKLNNGNLVIHYNRLGDVLGAYIVTSYRGKTETNATQYCSLVCLDTGYIKFEERCSRSTTILRVLSHLNHGNYKGSQALADGQYIEVYSNGDYSIDLSFDRSKSYE